MILLHSCHHRAKIKTTGMDLATVVVIVLGVDVIDVIVVVIPVCGDGG